jgi:hypothetical protein
MVFYRSLAIASSVSFFQGATIMRSVYFFRIQNKNFARADSYAQFTAGFAALNQRGFLRARALKIRKIK